MPHPSRAVALILRAILDSDEGCSDTELTALLARHRVSGNPDVLLQPFADQLLLMRVEGRWCPTESGELSLERLARKAGLANRRR